MLKKKLPTDIFCGWKEYDNDDPTLVSAATPEEFGELGEVNRIGRYGSSKRSTPVYFAFPHGGGSSRYF